MNMEWGEPILPIAGSHAGRSVVTVGWRAGSARASYRASITISAAVVKALKWDGVKAAIATPSVQGAHLRLAPAGDGDAGWSAVRPGKVPSCMSFLIPLLWVHSDKRQAAIVLHTIEDGALVLSLPDWARRKQPPQARAINLHERPLSARAAPGSKLASAGGAAPEPEPVPARGQNGRGRPPEALRAPLSERDRKELERALRRGEPVAQLADAFGQPVAIVNAVRLSMGAMA